VDSDGTHGLHCSVRRSRSIYRFSGALAVQASLEVGSPFLDEGAVVPQVFDGVVAPHIGVEDVNENRAEVEHDPLAGCASFDSTGANAGFAEVAGQVVGNGPYVRDAGPGANQIVIRQKGSLAYVIHAQAQGLAVDADIETAVGEFFRRNSYFHLSFRGSGGRLHIPAAVSPSGAVSGFSP